MATSTRSAAPGPKILVFSTGNISDPGIDLAGSQHREYSPSVMAISVPCSGGINPKWIVHALEAGFDGVFIAADGGDCAYLPDCTARTAAIVEKSQSLLRERGRDPRRVKMAAICSVCSEPFVSHMRQFIEALNKLWISVGMDYDVVIIGAGIAGMESALLLGDMGYRVLLVEKEPSIGGKMILLSKVFPTLDCASCIATPKMAAASHHPNLTVLTSSEVEEIIRRHERSFAIQIRKKPTFVNPAACTGCAKCEEACTVPIPDKFNAEMVATRAAHIAFPQAVPKKAVIERAGTSPCSFACPAGVKAHGRGQVDVEGRTGKARPAQGSA